MPRLDRRQFCYLLSLETSALLFGCRGNKASQSQAGDLIVTSYGGSWQQAERAAFFNPFTARFGVTINDQTYGGDLAQIKTMVDTGHVSWDVVDVESYMLLSGAAQNLYEPIDYSVVPKQELFPQAVNPFGVAICFWSTVLGYSTSHFRNLPIPAGWSDFWDTRKFPGPRGLRRSPISTLEIALLADGVKPSELYPLDVGRAFRSLDRIRPAVTVWWEAGEQPALLLSSGEVVMTSIWNGRLFDAAKAGKPVALTWNQGLVDADWWVIPRGTTKKKIAMQFVAFTESATQQSAYPPLIPYGPTNRTALRALPAMILRDLPTYEPNLGSQLFIDSRWWATNLPAVQERWEAWLVKA